MSQPQHFIETGNGFEVGGVIGFALCGAGLCVDGFAFRDICRTQFEKHKRETPGGEARDFGGVRITVEFTDQFSGPKG